MSAKAIEIGRLTTVENATDSDEGVNTYPIAMLITFDSVEELHAALESGSISFGLWDSQQELGGES